MTCLQYRGAIVCMPSDRWLRRRVIRCPFCQSRQEMVVRYEAWYGDTVMCTGCGDSWQDGELAPRPFARGWRKQSASRYRELWIVATYGPAPEMAELYGEDGDL